MSEAAEDVLDVTEDTPPPADGKAIVDEKPDLLDDNVDTTDKTDDKGGQADDLLSDDEDNSDEGAPDQYTFEPPEGVEVDQAALDQFNELARDLGLSQDAYQKIIEHDLQRSQDAETAAVDEWNSRVESWKQSAKADKEIGGEDFAESVKMAQTSLKQFADDDFRALLKSPSEDNPNGLALSNHPAMLRFLTRIGKVLADPSLIEGGETAPSMEAHDRMYPTMQK